MLSYVFLLNSKRFRNCAKWWHFWKVNQPLIRNLRGLGRMYAYTTGWTSKIGKAMCC